MTMLRFFFNVLVSAVRPALEASLSWKSLSHARGKTLIIETETHQLDQFFDLILVTTYALVITMDAWDCYVKELKCLIILVLTR